MPLINTAVPNLIQGVSQQPDASRFAGQCEEQENALSSVADGLMKRPNTRHVARLMKTAINDKSFIHFINRDDDEKFVVVQNGIHLRIFNIVSGNEAKINGVYGYPVTNTYLDSTAPSDDLKAITVADNTFLLNTSVVTKESIVNTPTVEGRALAFVKQGDFGKNYTVNFGKSAESAAMTYEIKRYDPDDSDD